MSYSFHAHWEKDKDGTPLVCVFLATIGREFSPEMDFRANEVVVSGISAAHLAMMGDGEITSEIQNDVSCIRLIPGKARAHYFLPR